MATFDYDKLAGLPFKKIVIEYSGSNDEGYINDIRPEPEVEGVTIGHDLYAELEQVAYDILEDSWAGWEINEGSHGHITIDVLDRSAMLHHGEIVESTTWHDSVVS